MVKIHLASPWERGNVGKLGLCSMVAKPYGFLGVAESKVGLAEPWRSSTVGLWPSSINGLW